MTDPDITAGLSPEDTARLMAVAQASSDAAAAGETKAEKTEAVTEAIKESAAEQFPTMSEKQLQDLAEKLAPIVVSLSTEPLTDNLIERLRELEVVFTPGQAPPAEQGTPEEAAAAEAATAVEQTESTIMEPPRKKTWAERFAGQ